jgi:hypothetical protein
VPATVRESTCRPDRLLSMRTRLSWPPKGINALLMQRGARDLRSGQRFDHTVFFGGRTDIHDIFPQDWSKRQGIPERAWSSIVNKTPLSFRTNGILGNVAPSQYLARLEAGDGETPPVPRDRLDAYLASHLIDRSLLRSHDFEVFMADRQRRLLEMIAQATGEPIAEEEPPEEGLDVWYDYDMVPLA